MSTKELKQQAREELERSNLYDSWELPSLTDKNGHLKSEWEVGKEMKDRENIALYKKEQLNNFLDLLIDKTVQQTEERIAERIEERQDLFNFVPEINGYKYIKAKDLDIINLITNNK